jgi:hypothetical protein
MNVQKGKQETLKLIVPENVLSKVQSITKEGTVHCPDLFRFSPDLSDWFLCEVKATRDQIR